MSGRSAADDDGKFLRGLLPGVGSVRRGKVAVLVPNRGSRAAAAIRTSLRHADIAEYNARTDPVARHLAMMADGPFDLVLDTTGGRVPAAAFTDTFLHLRPGGRFVVLRHARKTKSAASAGRDVRAALSELIARKLTPPPASNKPARDAAAFARAVGDIEVGRRHVVVTNTARAMPKVLDRDVSAYLSMRPSAGALLLDRPAVSFDSRCELRESPSLRAGRLPTTFAAPALSLRRYADVTCLPGQVVLQGNVVLPETYRRSGREQTGNRFTVELGSRFARPLQSPKSDSMPGAYFHLDSEYRGHFGHALTEQLSRLWAWSAAKQAEPKLKALLLSTGKRRELFAFERALYAAAGIAPEDLVLADRGVRVSTLYGATPMFSQPDYVHADIADLWREVGERLAEDAPDRPYPTRFFCGRRGRKRACKNSEEVEKLFAANGFEIVYPEDYPLAEQVRMFREAEAIGGYAGSALFTMAFSGAPKRVVVVSSEAYIAKNEYFMASVLGHHMDIVWAKPDIPMPTDVFRREAFHSPYAVEMDGPAGTFLRETFASL